MNIIKRIKGWFKPKPLPIHKGWQEENQMIGGHTVVLQFSNGTYLDPFYRCLNCGSLINGGSLNGIIKSEKGCMKCGKRGWVEHDPEFYRGLEESRQCP